MVKFMLPFSIMNARVQKRLLKMLNAFPTVFI